MAEKRNFTSSSSSKGSASASVTALKPKTASADSAYKLARHNRTITILKVAMPSFVVLIIALILVWPEIMAQKERFKLGLGRPLITGKTDTLSIVGSKYFSTDAKNQPFKLTSDLAEETEAGSGIIALTLPTARLELSSGTILTLRADKGIIYQKEDKADLSGTVTLTTDKAQKLTTSAVSVDMKTHDILSHSATKGTFPEGEIVSQGLQTKDKNDILKFTGPATLTFRPKNHK